MLKLRQSTAQTLKLGPFEDDLTHGVAQSGLSIANTDIRVSKNGADFIDKNSGGATHDEIGYYTTTLDATDTNTVGILQIGINLASGLGVYHEFQVMEEAAYDVIYASGATAADAQWVAGGRLDLVLSGIPVDVWNDPSTRTLTDPAGFKKNTAADINFVMVDSDDGITPLAGETVTASRSLDGAAFDACANSVTGIASGVYSITLAAADTNADILTLQFTSSGAVNRLITIKTET
jgi:hypothetical protein